jgi:hypothetical protein
MHTKSFAWGFFCLSLIGSVAAQAEVEIEGDGPLYIRGGVDADEEKPMSLPKFENPFEADTDEVIATKVTVLPVQDTNLHLSKEIPVERSLVPLPEGVDVEILLPRNRCELGTLRWGSREEGVYECRVLGRGQSVFGSLKLLAGLQATQKAYKKWTIGTLPRALTAKAIKKKEHFGTEAEYTHCMFSPESVTNGSTITERPHSKIGHYLLDTGKRLHPGKEKWGHRLDAKGYLVPVRMNKVDDPGNKAYANEGILLQRYDFWLHSHENGKDEFPLEAHSTWGCPRLTRSCVTEVQAWVAKQNEAGKKPMLVVREAPAATSPEAITTTEIKK